MRSLSVWRVFGGFAKGRGARKANEIGRKEDVRREAQRVRTGRKEEGREAVVGEFERFRRFKIGRLTNFRAVGASGVERRGVRFANELGAVAKSDGGTVGGRFGDKKGERGNGGLDRLVISVISVILGVFSVVKRKRRRGKRGCEPGEGESTRKFFRSTRREEGVELLEATTASGGDFRVGRRNVGLRRLRKLKRLRRLRCLGRSRCLRYLRRLNALRRLRRLKV